MKSLKQLVNEVDDKTQHLMMFKRLIDQNYKTSEDKISAMTALANLVLGPQDVKMLVKSLNSPPPLPGQKPTTLAATTP